MSSNREIFFRHLAQTSDFPMGLEIERGEGIYLIDPDGKKYIDLISGIAVSHLGHANPFIQKAIIEQVNKNMHVMVYGEFIQSPQVQLAHLLGQHLPKKLSSVYLVNSGSEAVEGAMKLAKRFTGRKEIICFDKAYHGSTQGALSMIGSREMQDKFFPLLPGIQQLKFNSIDELQQINTNHAAVFIEPIQGEAGVRIADLNFLKALKRRCTETETLLIFDESQSAFGRTGKLFSFEHYGIIPDVLILSKALGGGMPLGAFISSPEILSCLQNNPILGHITTFGGHPVSCAASVASIHYLLEQKLMGEVDVKEKLFRELLKHPSISEVRGKGLMLAIQLKDFETVQSVIQNCLKRGLISDWFLFCDNAIRIAPPLTISEEEIKKSCTIILHALDDTASITENKSHA